LLALLDAAVADADAARDGALELILERARPLLGPVDAARVRAALARVDPKKTLSRKRWSEHLPELLGGDAEPEPERFVRAATLCGEPDLFAIVPQEGQVEVLSLGRRERIVSIAGPKWADLALVRGSRTILVLDSHDGISGHDATTGERLWHRAHVKAGDGPRPFPAHSRGYPQVGFSRDRRPYLVLNAENGRTSLELERTDRLFPDPTGTRAIAVPHLQGERRVEELEGGTLLRVEAPPAPAGVGSLWFCAGAAFTRRAVVLLERNVDRTRALVWAIDPSAGKSLWEWRGAGSPVAIAPATDGGFSVQLVQGDVVHDEEVTSSILRLDASGKEVSSQDLPFRPSALFDGHALAVASDGVVRRVPSGEVVWDPHGPPI
jgi:hypothetical protein